MIRPFSRHLRPRCTGVLVANLAASPFVLLAVATGHLWEFVSLGTFAGCTAWQYYDRRQASGEASREIRRRSTR